MEPGSWIFGNPKLYVYGLYFYGLVLGAGGRGGDSTIRVATIDAVIMTSATDRVAYSARHSIKHIDFIVASPNEVRVIIPIFQKEQLRLLDRRT